MKLSPLNSVIIFLFVLSGMCGLVCEVAWSRYLALFIGNTAYSHMIVLATFMGGLALGALFWGRYTDKVSNHLRLYGLLEVAIGIYCFGYPYMIGFAEKFFIGVAPAFGGASSHPGLLAIKFILSFLTLIVPTFFMGGTLPILTKFLAKNVDDAGKDVATLYYANSLGAVIGTGLAGFFLIRWLSLDGTVWFAASLYILIGLLALFAARSIPAGVQAQSFAVGSGTTPDHHFSQKAISIAIITAAVSGFIALLYELAWIRLLSNILGSTTYSFTVMLVAFISGITIGSFIVSRIIKRTGNLVALLGYCQYATAISMILTLPFYERLPYYLVKISSLLSNQPEKFPLFLSIQFLLCFALMFFPTILSGMSLPLAGRIASSNITVLGKSIGGVFSINTAGSVAGALVTGLLLIPLLGVKLTIETGVLLNGLIGLVILLFYARVTVRVWIGFAAFFVLSAVTYKVLFPEWNKNLFVAGAFRAYFVEDAQSYRDFKEKQTKGRKILWYKEGVNANVAIRESAYGDTLQRSLFINGKADATSHGDLPTQVLQAQIPLMLYPDSGDALVVGLGSGITCGSALCHPIKSLDCIEIASEVVACNGYFAAENYNFMADPRTKMHIDDAMTYLKTTTKKYDYIISQPSNPWIAGIGDLYSLEYYNLCKSKLRPGGVVAQWFHTYDVDEPLFRLIFSTISRAFPHVTMWKIAGADVVMLASADFVSVDFAAMERKLLNPRIASDLARINIADVPALLSTQILSARNNEFKYGNTEVNTTNRPLVEFLAPLSLFTHGGAMMLLDSLDERIWFQDRNLWLSAFENWRPLTFQNYLNMARYRHDDLIGDVGFAYTALRKCLQLDSTSLEAQFMMARVTNMLGLQNYPEKELRALVRTRTKQYPDNIDSLFASVMVLVENYTRESSIVNQQPMDDAVELMKRCLTLTNGREERFHVVLAQILAGAGRYTEAAQAFSTLLQTRKAGATSGEILPEAALVSKIGENFYNAGNTAEAANYFRQAQSLDPTNGRTAIMLDKIALKNNGIR